MSHMDNSPSARRHEIDRVLHSKRKLRESKACYPCRQRKVKCDGTHPCRTCVRREHPEICAYDVDTPRKRVAQPSDLPEPEPSPRIHRPRSSAQLTDDTSHAFGDNSVVSILGQQDPHGTMAREATSVLGLHNTYLNYPFIDSRSPEERWVALLDVVPHRNEVLRFFHFYRASAYPFNPILIDVDQFESDICIYLGAYASGELRDRGRISDHWASPKSIGHISLLLATLAAGVHFSDLENPQSSCAARRSFQALRLANFLFRPSLDVVQSLLILGNTLQNNGQSDAAWALLGTTVRLAQTLGLHSERGTSHWPEHARSKAKFLWSMTVWQDSLLSLCYDRPPIVSTMGWASDYNSTLSYAKLMQYLCWIALSILRMQEPYSEPSHNLSLLAELDSTYSKAEPHLLQRKNCRNLQQNLEHLALRIHVSSCISALCRPAIRESSTIEDPSYVTLRARAKASLVSASKACLDFQALSIVPLRTWSMVHTVLSSMLLLCTWQETRDDAECKELQQRVIEVFTAANSTGNNAASEYSEWLSARHIRALLALRQSLENRSTAIEHEREQVSADSGSFPGDAPQAPVDLFGFAGELDFSPVTYLDSIMNVPLFDLPEQT